MLVDLWILDRSASEQRCHDPKKLSTQLNHPLQMGEQMAATSYC